MRSKTPRNALTGLAAGLCMVGLVSTAWAAEGGMTAADLAGLRAVVEVVPSPGGPEVAYVLSVPRKPLAEEDGKAWKELHVLDAEGNSRRYAGGEVRVSDVAWHRESSGWAISFLAKRGDDKNTSLYSIPLGGGEARRVAAFEEDLEVYGWSPAGGQLAFLAREPEEESRVELREKGFSQKIHEEDWRPKKVYLLGLGVEGETPRALEIDGSVRDLLWGPAGERLALKVSPTPLVDDSYLRTHIWLVHAASGEVLTKIANPGKLGRLAWSPSGGRLAFVSAVDQHDPKEGHLMVANTSTGKFTDLTPDLEGHVERIAFSDDDQLVFLVGEGMGKRLALMDVPRRTERTLLDAGGPAWSEMALHGEGMALIGSLPEHPAEVYRLPGGKQSPRRLTDSNPWLTQRRLARQEVVKYKARDGLEIEGVLIHPLERKEGQRVPLILVAHGGPESHFSNGWLTGWNRPGQVAAARGYAVFYPNYRASTGRGVEFSKLNHRDPGGKEFDDLVDGVDYLIERGLVDGDKVGITGGSYGGYATAWGATYYSERFAAGVMSVGISDKITSLGTSDIPTELYSVHLREWPWENWQHFLERSPIYHVKKAKTPLLILHGEDDTRVYPAQSLTLYRFLKLLDQAPVRLVWYPKEGHGNSRAASRFDYHLRQMRWFDHYLKGDGGEPPEKDLDYGAVLGR